MAVRRLWLAGGEPASQAAQIAWECRHSIPFRDAVVPWVSEMVGSDDCAVRRTAAALSRAWGQVPLARTAPLPAVYRLELPPDPRAGRFEPPSGISPTSSGLWTEDPFTWTWPLEEALTATAEASGLQLANLRHRAAQLEHFASRLGRFCPHVWAEVFMAGAYSKDLRSRVLAAVEAGESAEAAARRFAVGRSTAYRWVSAAREEGRRAAKPMRGGPAPRIAGEVEAAMLDLAGRPNHLSLAEIAARLAQTHGVRVHLTTVHRALRRAGWT